MLTNAPAGSANSLTSPWHPATPRRPAFTNLHQSILDGRLPQAQYMVARHGAALDVPDLYGRTPLTLACLLTNKSDALAFAKLLLQAGFRAHLRDSVGRTALMYAAINEHERIVRKLLLVDLTLARETGNDGNTALMHAAVNGNARIVKLLVLFGVKHNFPVNHRNRAAYTALLLACRHAHYLAALVIYELGGALASVRDGEFFRTPLDWIRENMKLMLLEVRPEPKPHMGEVWAHSPFTIFNREVTLSAYYRERSISGRCKHQKHLNDPFQIPARLHRSVTMPGLTETPLLTSRATTFVSVSEKSDERTSLNWDEGESLTEDDARIALVTRFEALEKRLVAKNGHREPLRRRLPTAKLVHRQPNSRNLSTKEALHSILEIYGDRMLQLRNEVTLVDIVTQPQLDLPAGKCILRYYLVNPVAVGTGKQTGRRLCTGELNRFTGGHINQCTFANCVLLLSGQSR